MTPSDVCNAIKFCDAVAHALPVGCDRRCRCGPGTHVWGRHVDCIGRLRVQVPRPAESAQVRADSTGSENGSSLGSDRWRPLHDGTRTGRRQSRALSS